ncbi:MAG: hypothetical protein JSS28_02915 [Proteobacteria bacterium]|nr:hypothetical protein [Pseudomonadota bacterium]
MNSAAARWRDRARLRVPHAMLTRGLRAMDAHALRRTRAGARRVVDLINAFVADGVTPLASALGVHAPCAWQQYARTDAAAQRGGDWFFYYHAHDRGVPGEHGHFHVFRRLPDKAKDGGEPRYAHLVGIGVDARGLPRRLFTTNRWVTNESWRSAREDIAALERIIAARAPAASPVQDWLRALLALFSPQVVLLLRHRDRRVAAHGGARVLEDRRMHVLSECAVSLDDQIAAIDAATP